MKTKLFAASVLVLATALAVSLGGCGANGLNASSMGDAIGGPIGGFVKAGGHEANALALSEKDEDALGQSIGVALTNQYGVYQDQKLETYVTLVGLTVANSSPNPGGNYVFGVLDTDDINAFSGPNGYIFVTRGAIAHMHDEAELAGVLAHEITHVCNHDGLHQTQAAEQQAAIGEAAQSYSGTAQFSQLVDTGVDAIAKTGYSQPQEFAADKSAVSMMAAAGYDPHSFLHFLRRLQTLQAANPGGGIMSTHPGTPDRITKVIKEINDLGNPTGASLADRFHQNVAIATE